MSIVLDKNSIRFLPYLLLVLLAMVLYWEMAAGLLQSWQDREEFSHGYFLPVIAGYFIWQKRSEILSLDRLGPSWLGVAICVVALLLYLIGSIGLTPYVQRISILVLIYGVFIAALGFRVTPFLLIPLTLIFMSFPLPVLVNSALTAKMQLISSELGVMTIRLFDIPVFLEGNVIDIGVMKLQVVEACSGLRYMYPLLSLSLILAYLFKVAMWKRVLIFISAIPVTIAMNSFRIGMIGVLVEYYGVQMATGFLHDFEGWIIFVACFGILFIEMWLLTIPERRTRKFHELLDRF